MSDHAGHTVPMPAPVSTTAPARPPRMTVLTIVLLITCVVSAGALVMVHEATKVRIADQKRMVMARSIRAVIPECENEPIEDPTELMFSGSGVRTQATTFYRGKKNGEYDAVAFPVTTTEGYSGDITLMMGVTRDGELTMIEILDHHETPGLGAKATEPAFKGQFEGKKRTLDNTAWAVTKDGGELDAIAGATITPRAIINAVKQGLTFFKNNTEAIFGPRQCLDKGTGQVIPCIP